MGRRGGGTGAARMSAALLLWTVSSAKPLHLSTLFTHTMAETTENLMEDFMVLTSQRVLDMGE